MTVSAYVRQLEALLPRGKLFAALGPNFRALLEGIAEEFDLAEEFLRGAFAETNPLTATHTLAEWEAKYQLPNDGTIESRRVRIQSRRASRRRARPEDYRQRFAALLGLSAADVQVIEVPSMLASYALNPRDVYLFAIFRDPFLPGHYVLADAEALLDDYVQSHTLGRVIESTCARCGDPFSPCDSALLEAPEMMTGRTVPYSEDALFWFRGDDPGATFGSGDYLTIPNRGTLGGTLTAMSGGGAGPGPDVVRVGGRTAPDFAAGECLEGTTSSFRNLHEPGTDATLFVRFRATAFGAVSYLARDYPTGQQLGFEIEISAAGNLNLRVKDGTSNVLLLTHNGLVVGTDYLVEIRKTDAVFELFVNGTLSDDAVASNLVAGVSTMTARIGGYAPTVSPFGGSIHELVSFGRALNDDERERVRSYFAYAWSPGTPWALPALLWCESDDRATTFDVEKSFASIPNRGHLGGSILPAVGPGPSRVAVAGKWAPLTTTNGGFMFGDTSSLVALHEAAGGATLSMALRIDALPGSNRRVFTTRTATAGARGLLLRLLTTGALQLDVGDGTVERITLSGAALPLGWHDVQVERTGLLFEIYVDGALYASATAASLGTGAHASATFIGSASDDSAPFPGVIPAFGVHPWALSPQELGDVDRYFRRWTT